MQKSLITTVVAHIDHGKTTLIDSLLEHQGIISKYTAGNIRYLDTRKDEQERGITLKLSVVKIANNENDHYIIDTPGHVDFESLVVASSHMADNFILIIDVNEGVTPRLKMIINHIDSTRTILVINKMDNMMSVDTVENITLICESLISRVNCLLDKEVFGWNYNNVIIAWSTMCCGMSKEKLSFLLKNNVKMKNNLKNAIKYFIKLKKKVEMNDIANIMSIFNIKKKTKKDIYTGVIPLKHVLFDLIEKFPATNKIDSFYKTKLENSEDNDRDEDSMYKEDYKELDEGVLSNMISNVSIENKDPNGNHSKFTVLNRKLNVGFDIKQLYTPPCALNNLSDDKPNDEYAKKDTKINHTENNNKIEDITNRDDFLALTTFTRLGNQKKLISDNLLFATRIFQGKISKGDVIITTNNQDCYNCKVEAIFEIDKNNLVEVSEASGPKIVFLKGNFLKQSFLHTSLIIIPYSLIINSHFLYMRKIIVEEDQNLNEFKEAIKTLSFLENGITAKVNEYNEFEISCEGEVQFEKICCDLKNEGFKFKCSELEMILSEAITKNYQESKQNENISYNIKLYNNQDFENIVIEIIEKENKDIKYKSNYLSYPKKFENTAIENAFYNFVENGCLINENVRFLSCYIDIFYLKFIDYDNIYYHFSEIFRNCYDLCKPSIIAFYLYVDIGIINDYIGIVYEILNKNNFIFIDESCHADSKFNNIVFLMPQFKFFNACNELKNKTKGTIHITAKEYGFQMDNTFEDMIFTMKKKKGMFISEILVEDPEKQRNLKK